MKRDLNKDLIEGLQESTNVENIENLNAMVKELVSEAMQTLSDKSSFIQMNKWIFVPVNELYLSALCSKSEYTYFLGVSNTEIELNSLNKKHYFQNFWKRIVRAWKATRKKKKKKKKEVSEEELVAKRLSAKYTIDDLKSDIIFHLSNFVTPTTIIYDFDNHISIIGKEDFGSNVKINIYVCMFDEKNRVFKLYNGRKNKFYDIDFTQRFSNLANKMESCGKSFQNLVKIFNSLYSRVYNKVPNQILIESLLFNCPDNLFVNDIYQTFLNVSNYIRLVDVTSLRSICDNTKTIFKEKLVLDSNAQVDFSRLLRILDNYKV